MIARLLNLCGVYLGQEVDLLPADPTNPEGFWENQQFVSLNEELLAELGGDWDYPPRLEFGWNSSSRVDEIRSEAAALIQQFSQHKYWGWKDPRNSFTFSFWKELIPSPKVIICVRNPLEVANSLLGRNNHSRTLAFNLWFEYNRRILQESEPENRIITHYDAYFHDPVSELARVLRFLKLEVPEEHIARCLETVDGRLHHNQSTFADLVLEAPGKVIDLYQKLQNQTLQSLPPEPDIDPQISASNREAVQNRESMEKNISLLSLKLASAKQIIKEKEKNIQTLQAQLTEREKELAEIYRSKAWRFIQTFRRTRHKILGKMVR
jgi:Uncharacterized protein conserved in bacteria